MKLTTTSCFDVGPMECSIECATGYATLGYSYPYGMFSLLWCRNARWGTKTFFF